LEKGLKYKVTIVTGSDSSSKPSDAFVVLYGKNGSSSIAKLDKSKEHKGHGFEQGFSDTFSMRFKENIGPVTHVQVLADFSGFSGRSARWRLASVSVLEVPASGNKELKTFTCNAILDANCGHCFSPELSTKQQLEWDALQGHKLNKHFLSKSWDERCFCLRGGFLCVRCNVCYYTLWLD
jgi:hypothetical protein